MNYFGALKNNHSESQETPFFHKQKLSIFDDESQRHEFQAFEFFNDQDAQVKPSILSQIQNGYQKEPQTQNKVQVNDRIQQHNDLGLNINFPEPFSFEPQINLIVPANKQQMIKQQKEHQKHQHEVKKKIQKELKWKKNFLTLEINSEPLKFQNRKNQLDLLKNDSIQNLQLKEVLLNNNSQDKIKNSSNIQKELLIPNKGQKRKDTKSKLFQQIIKRRKQTQSQSKQIYQQNNYGIQQKNLIANPNQKVELSSNIKVSSEFLILKNNDFKPTLGRRDFLGNFRCRKKSSKKLNLEKQACFERVPQKQQNVQKRNNLTIHTTKQPQQIKDLKFQQKEENNQIFSKKKPLFSSEDKQSPRKTRFAFAQKSKLKDNLSKGIDMNSNRNIGSNFQQTICKTSFDSKISNSKVQKAIFRSQLTQEDITEQISFIKQNSEQQKVNQKEGLKQQLRKFGGRTTQKFESKNFPQHPIFKQLRNKQKQQLKQILSSQQKEANIQEKQKFIKFQIIKKQKKDIIQQQTPLLKEQQTSKDLNQITKEEGQIFKASTPQVFNRVETSRLISNFVRSMKIVMEVAAEAEKLRERVYQKKNMFTELAYQEKRMRKRLEDLLERTKQI